VAATEARRRISSLLITLLARCTALLGGVLALAHPARAIDLPEDKAEALLHYYDGGGVKAFGPAFLVRKNVMDKVSLSGTYYVDSVSNASIDVVTTASKYHETRNEFGLSADYVYRDAQITVGATTSREPDYTADAVSLDVSQEVFGGMTTVALGFTRGSDDVKKKNSPEFHDYAKHWQYRVGITQILTPRWISSVNFEAVSDDGFLGSPYRAAREFGAFVPERMPRTRSSRAMQFRVIGDLGSRDAIHGSYRYFWDNWEIKAHTLELGYSRYFGDRWLADSSLRYTKQSAALFYSDNADAQNTYVTRNRQLGSYNSIGLGGKVAYSWRKVPGKYEIKANGGVEYVRYKYNDFTDVRSGSLYSYGASILQLYLTATF